MGSARGLLRPGLIFAAGLSAGFGLLMLAQVECLSALRDSAKEAGSLWRGLGELTFDWQGDTTKAALWAHQAPEGYLRNSSIIGWTWIGVGFVALVGSVLVGPSSAKTR